MIIRWFPAQNNTCLIICSSVQLRMNFDLLYFSLQVISSKILNGSNGEEICHTWNLDKNINTDLMKSSTIVFTLKMWPVSKNTIFGLKLNNGEKWSRKIYFEIPPKYFPLLTQGKIFAQNHKFITTKITIFPHGGISKLIFLDHFSTSYLSFLAKNDIFGYRFHFEG